MTYPNLGFGQKLPALSSKLTLCGASFNQDYLALIGVHKHLLLRKLRG